MNKTVTMEIDMTPTPLRSDPVTDTHLAWSRIYALQRGDEHHAALCDVALGGDSSGRRLTRAERADVDALMPREARAQVEDIIRAARPASR